MQKITTTLLIGAVLNIHVHGQPTFQKYYYGVGNARNHIQELFNGNILIGNGAPLVGTSILDPEGNIVRVHSYLVDSFLALQAVKSLSANEFVFAGGYHFPGLANQPVIGRMDSLGNVLRANYYQLPVDGNNTAGDIELLRDSGVVAWNRYLSTSIFNSFFAIRTDAFDELVWAKDFGQGGHFRFFKELPNGDLLAGVELDSGGAAILRMGPSGNIIWAKSYVRPNGTMLDGLIESDSSFTVIGHTDRAPGNGTKLFMMRLDGIGEVQWCKGYDAPSGWYTDRAKIDRTRDGNYAVLANIIGHGRGKAFLMKTDLNGDTIWTRAAGVASNRYDVYDLLAHSDGGFLFNGQGYDLGIYLFKTDSLGHLPCPEHEQWYPVQVQDLFPIDSSFTLTAIDGAVRYPATINDTIYDPVTVVEGCLITEVPPHYARTTRPRIRPNPTTGRFTVEFPDPLQASSYYSVYDSMGRLLYQRPLPTGATLEDVDLSRFGRGTYTIRFTSPDGVQHERVVLE
ncbi:MAG: T9SS type A sorting domain-containing protein [Flavobacteriales bacterium]